MGYPLILILTSLNWVASGWKDTIKTIRAFQEVYSTAGIGMFVNLGAETHEGRTKNMELVDTAVKCHLLMAPYPLIYNLYHEEIRNRPHLAAYFEQFPSWKAFKLRITDPPEWWNWPVDIIAFLAAWASLFAGMISFQSSYAILQNPYLMITPVKAKFADKMTLMGGAPIAAMKAIIAELSTHMHAFPQMRIHEKIIRLIHPLIDLEWGVMKAAITQLYTYEVILARNPGGLSAHNLPVPFTKGQRFRIRKGDESIWWGPFFDEGWGEVTIPVPEDVTHAMISSAPFGEYPRYRLDTHGILSPWIILLTQAVWVETWEESCTEPPPPAIWEEPWEEEGIYECPEPGEIFSELWEEVGEYECLEPGEIFSEQWEEVGEYECLEPGEIFSEQWEEVGEYECPEPALVFTESWEFTCGEPGLKFTEGWNA